MPPPSKQEQSQRVAQQRQGYSSSQYFPPVYNMLHLPLSMPGDRAAFWVAQLYFSNMPATRRAPFFSCGPLRAPLVQCPEQEDPEVLGWEGSPFNFGAAGPIRGLLPKSCLPKTTSRTLHCNMPLTLMSTPPASREATELINFKESGCHRTQVSFQRRHWGFFALASFFAPLFLQT